jgi:hypothetical protein
MAWRRISATQAEFFPRSLRYCSVVFSCAIGVAGSAKNYSSEVQPLDHSSEKAEVVKDLLQSLVKRGIDASVQRLFVIEASNAINSAI